MDLYLLCFGRRLSILHNAMGIITCTVRNRDGEGISEVIEEVCREVDEMEFGMNTPSPPPPPNSLFT